MYSRVCLFFPVALAAAGQTSAQIAAAPCFETGFGTNLHAGDDTVAQNNLLGFLFPGPAGPVTSIDISSNGFVWLGSNSNPRTNFLTSPPCIAAMLEDLDPSAAGGNGGVFFNTFPASASLPARAVVTWAEVPEFLQPAVITAQLQLLSTGEIVITHGPDNTLLFHDVVIGVTQGNGAIANQLDFVAIGSTPANTGSNPTAYQHIAQPDYQLASHSYEFIPNGQGGYLVLERWGCRLADFDRFGYGCANPPVVYEEFDLGNLDLANHSLLFTPNGIGGWIVTAGANQFAAFANNLNLGDDDVAQNVALGFAWNHPGGSVSSVDVSANGFVWLASNANPACCAGNSTEFLLDSPRIAPLWVDLDPSSGGGVYADQRPGAFFVTWSNVPEYGSTTPLTFQLAMFGNGSFELRYHFVANALNACVVGYSTGNGAYDPGNRDLTALIPFTSGAGSGPLTLGTTARSHPVLNTTFNLDVGSIDPASSLGFLVFGFAGIPRGLDLAPLGMPRCRQWVSLDLDLAFPISGGSAVLPIGIPNAPNLIGTTCYCQAATWTPGANALGLLTSNGGRLVLGL